ADAPFAHVVADLGGDDHLVAAAALPDPAADHGLRFAARVPGRPPRIHVRRVDEVEARVDPRIEQRERGALVGGPAEHVAAEAKRRDLEGRAAQLAVFHRVVPFQCCDQKAWCTASTSTAISGTGPISSTGFWQ